MPELISLIKSDLVSEELVASEEFSDLGSRLADGVELSDGDGWMFAEGWAERLGVGSGEFDGWTDDATVAVPDASWA